METSLRCANAPHACFPRTTSQPSLRPGITSCTWCSGIVDINRVPLFHKARLPHAQILQTKYLSLYVLWRQCLTVALDYFVKNFPLFVTTFGKHRHFTPPTPQLPYRILLFYEQRSRQLPESQSTITMSSPTVKLSSGHQMPLVGVG